jgi:hypothetical protein
MYPKSRQGSAEGPSGFHSVNPVDPATLLTAFKECFKTSNTEPGYPSILFSDRNSIPERRGGEVELQLLEQSGLDELLDDVRAARDLQVHIAPGFAPIGVDESEMMKPRVTVPPWLCPVFSPRSGAEGIRTPDLRRAKSDR